MSTDHQHERSSLGPTYVNVFTGTTISPQIHQGTQTAGPAERPPPEEAASAGTPEVTRAGGARHRAEPDRDRRAGHRVAILVAVISTVGVVLAALITIVPSLLGKAPSAPRPDRSPAVSSAPSPVSAPSSSSASPAPPRCRPKPVAGPIEATIPAGVPGVDSRYRFCWALVNGGDPIATVQYPMTGEIVGPPPAKGNELALLGTADPSTCDELGNPGTSGWFVKARFPFSGGSLRWKAVGSHAYDEGRTIRIRYVFVEAPSSTLAIIQNDREAHRNDGDYPGFLRLPDTVTELAEFSVRAKEPDPGQRCD